MSQYWISILGGVLIGLSASGMLLSFGRVTGISGILTGSVFEMGREQWWRLGFIAGLVVGGFLFYGFSQTGFESLPNRSVLAIALGGLLVGFGTSMGSGCTSGHGVCGVSRLSKRSIVATLVFMGSGMITVYIIEHLLGSS